MDKIIKYSVVIPVYNSEQSLIELVSRLYAVFTKVVKESFEIIFIDDYSPNSKTFQTLEMLSNKYEFVNVFQLTRNFGQGGATMAGLSVSKGVYIITMDDDLQQRPEDIPLLIKKQDHDVVIGRFIAKDLKSPIKGLGSKLKGKLDTKLLGLPIGLKSTSFKLINSEVAQNMLKLKTSRPFIIALILNVTQDIINVDVVHQASRRDKSNYSLVKSIKLFSNLIISNSSILLRIISLIGFILALLSFITGIILVIRKIVMPDISQGWTSIMVVSLFNLGLLLFSVGLVGEYLYRLEETTRNRPMFLLKRKV